MRSAIASFTLGILLLQQQAALMSWQALAALMVLAILLLTSMRGNVRLNRGLFTAMGSFLIGWCWASLLAMAGLAQQLAVELEERDMTLSGVVTSLPAADEYGQRFQFQIEQVLTPGVDIKSLPKKILLNWYGASSDDFSRKAANVTIQPAERWQLNVRLRRPHGLANPHGFDSEVWMLEQGLGATGTVRPDRPNDRGGYANRRISEFVFGIRNCIELARGKLRDHILRALPDRTYAPIIVALVIGDQNGLSKDEWQVFSRTGVSHLIAISGLHISMLAGLAYTITLFAWSRSLWTRYSLPLWIPAQKVAALSGVLVAMLYVALAGFGIPAQRSLIMIAVLAAVKWFDRSTSVVNALFLALGLVLLVDPWAVLWPGFWLSFSAVGLIFYASLGRSSDIRQRPTDRTERKPSLQFWRSACTTQYAITLGLVPLSVLLFNQVSLVSPLANALAIPVISLLVTPMSLLGSITPDPAGTWILLLTHFILGLLHEFLSWLGQMPVWQAARPEMWMLLCAMFGIGWCLAPRGWPLRWAGLLLWLPLCLNKASSPGPGEFKVTALDVGQGMALLIETAGHRLLYDTGPAYSLDSDAGSRVIYPYLKMRGISRLDGMMISHNDSDHSGGAVSLMQQLQFDWVSSSLAFDSPVVNLAQLKSRHSACLAGQTWDWDEVHFEVLHPPQSVYASSKWKPNAKSCTLKITNAKQSMLLAGDIEAVQEDELVNGNADKLPSTVLLAPHHGSGTSSTLSFLQAVAPRFALFQLGYHNRYHHPRPDIWQRYAELGITRLRSDQTGAITFTFSDRVDVDEYRQTHARYWYPSTVSDYIAGN